MKKKINYGKFKGEKYEYIPISYIKSIYYNNSNPSREYQMKEYKLYNLNVLGSKINMNQHNFFFSY